jgi:multidrug efflux system membrane fusion protein
MRRSIVQTLIGLGAVVALVLVIRLLASGQSAGARSRANEPRAVPVLVEPVRRRTVPVWLEGLGTVSAWQQVTVRSQVDGRLERVFFKEGQRVRAGELLAQIDPRPFLVQLHQAEGALARDRAQLKAGKLDLDRYRQLADRRLIASQQLDQQRGTVGQAEGAVTVDLAAVESARLNLDYCKIRASTDGVVGVRLVDPGNFVRAADPGGLVVLTQLDPAAVFFTLPEDDLPRVTAAQRRGEVSVEAWSRDGASLLGKGKLIVVDNQINQATATLRLKAQLPNPDGKLWPNEFVKARLLVDTLESALVVPAAAVQRGPQGTFVYLVGPDNLAVMRKMDVALTIAEMAVVTDLAAGDPVVIEGQSLLRPGARVQVRKP